MLTRTIWSQSTHRSCPTGDQLIESQPANILGERVETNTTTLETRHPKDRYLHRTQPTGLELYRLRCG